MLLLTASNKNATEKEATSTASCRGPACGERQFASKQDASCVVV